MKGVRQIQPYRMLITRSVLMYYLLLLLWRGYCHLLPSQLESPTITKVLYDPFYWLFKLSPLPGLIVKNEMGAFIFTASLILSCVLCILFPLRRGIIILFSGLYFLLAIVFNIYLCHSSHYLAGMILMTFAFWPRKGENFDLLWEGLRYYACWIYGSAFLWKVILGSAFQWDAGVLSFKDNLAAYLYQNPDSVTSHMYYYFLQHPFLINLGHKLVILAEGLFLLGFFTKKYDVLLILTGIFIFISIYLFSDVFFIELQVVLFTLIPERTWKYLADKMPLLNRASRKASA